MMSTEKLSSEPVTPPANTASEPDTSPGNEVSQSVTVEEPKPISKTPPPAPQDLYPQPLSPSDEATWAMLAHLSVLANLVTGFLGPIIALAIYLVFKDRSRYVAYQSLQALIFQLIWWVGGGALAALAWVISGLLAIILVGCCLMPFALLLSFLPLVALVYGVIAAIQTSQHQDFRYWLIGEWVRGTLQPPA